MGEYYADYDEESGLWCVFHTDKKSGFAYSSHADSESAEKDAADRNDPDRLVIDDDSLLKKFKHNPTV